MRVLVNSGVNPTTGSPTAVGLVAATIKTIMQLKLLVPCHLIEWGISFDANSPATPGKVELCDTAAVFATGTQYGASGVDFNMFDAEARLFTQASIATSLIDRSSTTSSVFNASAEGSITALNEIDGAQLIAPTTQFLKQYPLGREPYLLQGDAIRMRGNFAGAVNCMGYMLLEF